MAKGPFKKIFLISLLTLTVLTSIKSAENQSNENNRLRYLGLFCSSGSFGINWYSTLNTGLKLDKATNTQNICLSKSDGIARYNDNYNFLTCITYHSACGEPKTSDIKKDICQNYSKYEKNDLKADRIIYSSKQKPDIKQISEWGSTISIVVADFANSSSLREFYNNLPADCKKPLDLTFDI
jgi:hypothetical protein